MRTENVLRSAIEKSCRNQNIVCLGVNDAEEAVQSALLVDEHLSAEELEGAVGITIRGAIGQRTYCVDLVDGGAK